MDGRDAASRHRHRNAIPLGSVTRWLLGPSAPFVQVLARSEAVEILIRLLPPHDAARLVGVATPRVDHGKRARSRY